MTDKILSEQQVRSLEAGDLAGQSTSGAIHRVIRSHEALRADRDRLATSHANAVVRVEAAERFANEESRAARAAEARLAEVEQERDEARRVVGVEHGNARSWKETADAWATKFTTAEARVAKLEAALREADDCFTGYTLQPRDVTDRVERLRLVTRAALLGEQEEPPDQGRKAAAPRIARSGDGPALHHPDWAGELHARWEADPERRARAALIKAALLGEQEPEPLMTEKGQAFHDAIHGHRDDVYLAAPQGEPDPDYRDEGAAR